ncbi:hypothetical protein [Aquisalinus flavus]|uniref:Uncharacterized protein n=1 Tax=Aquisalinus flavus TaxID=1526572 RepID=A0A8J2V4Y1_9PROT|nr:hypothetical protein [Aquisalinus flavus]MBD0427567.1 hypothetical protein [Aquisalinus flavus]UNE47359.1 hypothetical protein FF099_04425 [Aquisalinus flavus]GGD01973.1 hypothetical protein GCM10011342_08800 [Aquisalinus flavus]
MQDLAYLFSIGFSGSDLTRALWIGLLFSLLASRRFPAWRVTIFAFVLDRVWPFLAMSFAGAGNDIVFDSVIATILRVPDDAAYYIIRYLGLMGLIYFGYHVRRFLHTGKPQEPTNAYPY